MSDPAPAKQLAHAAAGPAASLPPAISIRRGSKKPSPLGTSIFIGMRVIDIPFQYKLLSGAWSVPVLSRLGLAAAAPVVSPAAAVRTGIAAIDRLRLSAPGLLLLSMACGGLAKQSYSLARIQLEEYPAPIALFGASFNVVYNTINSMLLVAAATSSTTATGPQVPIPFTSGVSLPLPMVVGAAMCGLGLFLELGSEIQRRRFKDRAENKGRICTTGFWRLARHINYGGYTLWRGGITLAAGGWLAGAVGIAFNAWGFIGLSTVELDDYMTKKYGEQWARYRKEVPWWLLPGIY